ncbi:MAG: hypothetical protein WA317_22285 [Mycobacterium sp.]|uniref:hypothetical protein n=1 Tax=Mycobacterium sp. TaxID=1785 RepID=UPI003CC5C889
MLGDGIFCFANRLMLAGLVGVTVFCLGANVLDSAGADTAQTPSRTSRRRFGRWTVRTHPRRFDYPEKDGTNRSRIGGHAIFSVILLSFPLLNLGVRIAEC